MTRSRGRGARSRAVGVLLAAVAGSLCCGPGPDAPSTVAGLRWDGTTGRNLIVIVNDTMRRDRLGIYGGPARTQAFDAFARDGLLFETATTQSPWTKPSIATLFTSLYPSQHAVVSHPSLRERREGEVDPEDAWMDVLGDDFTTLAEVLQWAGFRTAAFVGNPWLLRAYGFDQGFDVYDDSFAGWDVPGEAVSRAGLGWLSSVAPVQRFFLYLHYMDTHRPYGQLSRDEIEARAVELRPAPDLHPLIAERIAELVFLDDGTNAAAAGYEPSIALLEMAYDRGIERFDRALGAFLEAFESHPAHDETAIVVVSDHGESLYRRGFGNHGSALYDDEMAVPLAVRLPGVTTDAGVRSGARSAAGSGAASAPDAGSGDGAGAGSGEGAGAGPSGGARAGPTSADRAFRVEAPVGLVDLMPTLCTWLGVPPPRGTVFGQDWLAPAPPGGAALRTMRERPLVAEGVMFRPGNRAVRAGRYKAIFQPHPGPDGRGDALFDLLADPGELVDLLAEARRADEHAALFDELVAAGLAAIPDFDTPQAEAIPVDPETLERLRSLGYIR